MRWPYWVDAAWLLLLAVTVAVVFCGCTKYKPYTAWHPNHAAYVKAYRHAKCTPPKIARAKRCVLSDTQPGAECTMYLLRCAPAPREDWRSWPRARQ